MKKRIVSVLSVALVLCLALAASAMAKTLKIGSMSPLTGPYAADGQRHRQRRAGRHLNH